MLSANSTPKKFDDLFQRLDTKKFFHGCCSVQSIFQKERSIKLKPGQVIDRRILMGFAKEQKTIEEWSLFLKFLNVPQEVIRQILNNIQNADTLLFGIEEMDDKATLKVYLEYWNFLVSLIQQGKHDRQPFALNRGYKWEADSPKHWKEDIYWCYPLLTLTEIHNRIKSLTIINDAIFKYFLSPVLFQNRSLTGSQLIYLEVIGKDNARQSFDINCYKGQLSVADALPFLLELAQQWHIRNDLLKVLPKYSTRSLGHISGGVGRDNQPFLSIYVED
ncbi:hypothetical protein [Endozoicomonas acroporae]|uniref:hypothetical protein n=1 Tax=Endozoicomonas acroporae TaxID=1701104 RepID=UPI003D7BCCEF